MRSQRQFGLKAQFLVALNLFCVVTLAYLLGGWLKWGQPKGLTSQRSQEPQLTILSQRAKVYLELLKGELEGRGKDAKIMADMGTSVFSHPDSYRLAPQPGEYDYDSLYGVYGSTKNEGNSALLLSSSSALSPEILHDIRLTEYLNPPFKSFLDAHPECRSITLVTTDSLLCRFPWLDFRQQFKERLLKPDFKVSELPYFSMAAPEKNPQKKPVWTLSAETESNPIEIARCSAPIFVNEAFKGVVAVEFSFDRLIFPLLEVTQEPGELAFFLDNREIVLGMNLPLQAQFRHEEAAVLPVDWKGFLQRVPVELQPVLRKVTREPELVASDAGWMLKVAPVNLLPVRFLLLRPLANTATADPLGAWAVSSPKLVGGMLLLLVLILLNAAWIYRSRKHLEQTSHQLQQAFSALANLNLEAARIQNPKGFWRDLLNEFNDCLQAIASGMSAIPPDEMHRTDQGEDIKAATTDLEVISQKAQILGCFGAGDSIEFILRKLSGSLQSIFSVAGSGILFPSSDDLCFKGQVLGLGTSNLPPQMISMEINQNSSLGIRLKERGHLLFNSREELPEDDQGLWTDAIKNLFFMLLVDSQRRLGVVVLANKDSDFGLSEEERLAMLQEPICRVVSNLLQCEGFRQIDLLRRRYCRELFGVLEEPLNHIKTEVQSIYSRLGKLTPYYKDHCEQILFEVGRLYEIAHEASVLEDLSPKSQPPVGSPDS